MNDRVLRVLRIEDSDGVETIYVFKTSLGLHTWLRDRLASEYNLPVTNNVSKDLTSYIPQVNVNWKQDTAILME